MMAEKNLPMRGGGMSRIYVALALAIRAINGFCLGLYILLYAKIVGSIALHQLLGLFPNLESRASHVAEKAGNSQAFVFGIREQTLGAFYVLSIFVLEAFLQVWAGLLADTRGTRIALGLSFFVRSLFFVGLGIMATYGSNPIVFALAAIGSVIAFSVAYTTLEGNYENWVQSLADKKDTITRLFSLSAAIQHFFTVVGCLVSLTCLGAATTPADILTSPAIAWPFALAAGTCLIMALVTLLIPETKTVSNRDRVLADASKYYSELPRLRRLFVVAALVYSVLTTLSLVVPLVVLTRTSSLVDRFLILALGGYGPALLGSLSSAIRTLRKKPRNNSPPPDVKSDTPSDWSSIRGSSIAFGVTSIILGFTGYVLGGTGAQPIDLRTVLLFTLVLATTRFCHGRLDPLVRSLATLIIKCKYEEVCELPGNVNEERFKNTIMAFGERYKNYAGAFAAAVAVAASLVGAGSHLLFITLFTTAGLTIVAALRLARPDNPHNVKVQTENLSVRETTHIE